MCYFLIRLNNLIYTLGSCQLLLLLLLQSISDLFNQWQCSTLFFAVSDVSWIGDYKSHSDNQTQRHRWEKSDEIELYLYQLSLSLIHI